MRLLKKPLAVLAAAALAASCAVAPAFAETRADGEETTYTVRVYAGGQGTLDGLPMIEVTGVPYGDTVELDGMAVDMVAGSKYYAKCVREAGLDNVLDVVYYGNVHADGSLSGSLYVTEDADYVIGYGILANRVQYTVRYVDAQGNEIAEPETFYGDIGDHPAVAAAYVEGYVPDAISLTRTLVDDELENVFTFTYTRLGGGFTTVQNPDESVSVVAPNGVELEVVPPPAQAAAAAAATIVDNTTPAAGPATANAAAAAADNALENQPLVTPDNQQVIDENDNPLNRPNAENIDDNENALTTVSPTLDTEAATAPMGFNIACAVAVLGGAGVIMGILIAWRVRRRKEDKRAGVR